MNKIIAIVGPTGVGKTKLSIALAKQLNAEIISCDSMQFYKGLDIGTAKITQEEKENIPHHLIDILEPEASFSVAEYQKIVRDKIKTLQDKKITPILVGGSGLYISSVLYDYKFLGEKRDPLLEALYKDKSLSELTELLKKKDPELAKRTNLENKRRVLRALDKTDLEVDDSGKHLFYKNVIIIGLELDRKVLYERIEKRVDKMISNGLIEEAKQLYKKNLDSQATKAIGYKELFEYFDESCTLDDAIELIKRNSRRYAKRQMTWFKNKMDCHWISVQITDFKATINQAEKLIE